MAEKESTRRPETTTPDVSVPSSSSFPSGDYSYVLEIVMRMQETMGRLTEAVSSLKEQSKSHDEKLGNISRDIHTAKTTLKVVGVILAGAIAFAGWMIKGGLAELATFVRQQPQTQQSSPVAKP